MCTNNVNEDIENWCNTKKVFRRTWNVTSLHYGRLQKTALCGWYLTSFCRLVRCLRGQVFLASSSYDITFCNNQTTINLLVVFIRSIYILVRNIYIYFLFHLSPLLFISVYFLTNQNNYDLQEDGFTLIVI